MIFFFFFAFDEGDVVVEFVLSICGREKVQERVQEKRWLVRIRAKQETLQGRKRTNDWVKRVQKYEQLNCVDEVVYDTLDNKSRGTLSKAKGRSGRVGESASRNTSSIIHQSWSV